MRSAPWILSALVTATLVSPLVQADELQMPASAESSGGHPTRGMSMEKVEAAFGTPTTRVPAVGQPAITRWEYPGYVVYFENNIVLHTVVKS
jgi:hypothetical protein